MLARTLLSSTSGLRQRALPVAAVAATSGLSALSSPSPLFSSPSIRSSHALSAHKHDDPDNTPETPFDFTPENYETVERVIAKYPGTYKKSALMPLLDLAQRQNGNFLSVSAMDKVAKILEIPPIDAYQVASFFTMYNRTRVGKYFIQLCGTTPCMVCGAQEIKDTIESELGIKDGETTPDGMFTLLEVECLGACANAPMFQLNDDFYECLTPETTKDILDACKAGAPPTLTKWGSLPMNGQLSCEGPLGKTSLHGEPTGPQCRDLEGSVDPASVKDHMGY